MQVNKKENQKAKPKLHPRNKHRYSYDFEQLTKSFPELAKFVKLNKYNNFSIDFFNPDAVTTLNKALLKHYYKIDNWNIPTNYLLPPIPGRADYIHYIADLLANNNNKKIPKGKKIIGLDIGVGASCIYPILGNKEYDWSFIGSEIDLISIKSANKIIELNPTLQDFIEIRHQKNRKNIITGILNENEIVDFTICNPPFHATAKDAKNAAFRKLKNLKQYKNPKAILNFGGQNNELWYEGGEEVFVKNMIQQSKEIANSCFWFTSLVSKKSNLNSIYKTLKKAKVNEVKTIEMGQGNKISRFVAWTFLSPNEQKKHIANRW